MKVKCSYATAVRPYDLIEQIQLKSIPPEYAIVAACYSYIVPLKSSCEQLQTYKYFVHSFVIYINIT